MSCPCGSGIAESACCGEFLTGAPAPTAEALMRSRYTAYVRGAIDYLVATHDGAVDRAAIAAWSRDTEWLGLEIIATESRGDEAFVAFVARGITRGKPFAQRERSRFRRVGGRWRYVDGVPFAQPRNEPCACGSGKKFKRCHGA